MENQLLIKRFVDTREPQEIREALIERGWEQKYLYSGDYFFFSHSMKKIGVTRKTIEDLLGSLNERFAKQLEEMLDFYDYNIMIIEGTYNTIKVDSERFIDTLHASRSLKEVLNYLHRWQQKSFIYERTSSVSHTIQRLGELYVLYQKETSISAKTRLFTDDRILALPSGVRGNTGLKVISGKSLLEVANMTVQQLKDIDGIGDKKANLIFEHFHKARHG